MKRKYGLLTGFVVLSLLLTACSAEISGNASEMGETVLQADSSVPQSNGSRTQTDGSDPQSDSIQDPTNAASADGTDTGNQTNGETIEERLSRMTLEEKVGQMIFPAFRVRADGSGMTEADAGTIEAIEKIMPGGIAVFKENLESIQQTAALLSDWQAASQVPLFLSIDEEGGIVARLEDIKAFHATQMPEPFTIGKTENPAYAREAAGVIAKEIGSLGFNMNFAPVADIFSNPSNQVIGKRAYGTEPDLVSVMVAEAVQGYRENGIVSVMKHFPGHGDTTTDSHHETPVVNHDLERLKAFELKPFQAGIAAGAPALMTAHISVPNAAVSQLPVTLNKEILTGLLREEMRYDGLVITDAMEMKAITGLFKESEACIRAVEAGADMLLMPSDPYAARDALLFAVQNGRLTEERIDASVKRILRTKQEYGILNDHTARDQDQSENEAKTTGDDQINGTEKADPDELLGCEEHLRIVEKILSEAK